MGRKKSSNSKKTKSNSKSKGTKSTVDVEFIAVIVLIVLGILSFLIIYGKTGVAGRVLSPVLGGILGWIKYLIPFCFLGLAFAVYKENGKYVTTKILQGIILLAFIASVLTIYQMSTNAIDKTKGFEIVVEASYTLGLSNKGGGTIGAVIAYPLVTLFGEFGAAIVSFGVAAVLLVFTFGINMTDFIDRIRDRMDDKKEADEEARIERKARREKREKEEMENAKDDDLNDDDAQITINLNDKKNNRNKNKENDVNDMKEDSDDLFKEKIVEKGNKTEEVLDLGHDILSPDDENYIIPPIGLLNKDQNKSKKNEAKVYQETANKLKKTLQSFGVSAKIENVSVGPVITRYELKPAEGVSVKKIAKLSDDIALNLAAESIRIEAPIPGKQAVGIEIPKQDKEIVSLRSVIDTDEFDETKAEIPMVLGKNIAGDTIIADIAKMPHILIAGSTGSGKSVCINSLIMSILYKSKPSEVKLLMIDPKVVELSVYNGIPHLIIPVVTDAKKATGALGWAVDEMEKRYQKFASKGVRDIKGYNELMKNSPLEKLPQIVIIVDELADLMMVSSKEVETNICRLAQKARAAGMYLVIATQRPSVDVITGVIKANIPSRIAFAVSSQVDSRTILDMAGAEKLLGKGDMLYYPIGALQPVRVQGSFVSDSEVEKVVKFIKSKGEVTYNEEIIEQIENSVKSDKEKDMESDQDDDADEYLNDAIECAIEVGQISTSYIQRKFRVGYARAGRIIDQMEERGIISGYEGSKPRKVLITKEKWQELNMSKDNSSNENTTDEDE